MSDNARISQTAGISVLDLTPLNPAFREDPYALLQGLRENHPVMRDEAAGMFFLTRHEDVHGVINDRTHWRHPSKAEEAAVLTRRQLEVPGGTDNAPANPTIMLLDDPDHARIRNPLAQALYRRSSRFRPEVERIVDEALAAVEDRNSFDLIAEFALFIPINVIAAILGVAPSRMDEYRDWSEGIMHRTNPLRTPEQTEHMLRAGDAVHTHMAEMLKERRVRPQDDLVTDMVQLQQGGADLTDDDLIHNLIALGIAGNLATTDLIGNAVRLLLIHPAELAKLRSDPDLVSAAVEETLRYEPPVDITGRIASRELEISGCPIHATQSMLVSLRAANRDPEAFEDPDRFDIKRKKRPHVAFGGGAHMCIGASLARLQGQVALSRLFTKFPKLRMVDPKAPPQWGTQPFFRGLEHLEVAVG